MSDSDQNTPTGPEREEDGSPAPLLFCCSNCGKELTAPARVAGVEAPCPICGIPVTAPALNPSAPSDSPSTPPWSPESPGPSSPPPVSPAPAPVASKQRTGRSGRRRRSIDPSTGFSSSYEDRKEVGALVRIFLAVLFTAAIALSVYYLVNKKFQEPPPEPDFEIPLNR